MNTKTIITIIFFALAMPSQWIEINSSVPKSPEINILDSSFESTTISFRLNGFYLNSIDINGENYNSISFCLVRANNKYSSIYLETSIRFVPLFYQESSTRRYSRNYKKIL